MKQFTLPITGYIVFVVVIILFGVCTKLDSDSVPAVSEGANDTVIRTPLRLTSGSMMGSYGMMMDATAMCVMGFGFLYAFCKKYTWAGITFNLFICGLCFLWCQVCTCIVSSIFEGEFVKAEINITAMIGADLVTAAVLITFGVLYGFTSPTQLIIICLIEPLAMKINEHIIVHFLHTSDAGGSILTHAFGAIFGLGITLGLGTKAKNIPEENRKTTYTSDSFAMIGTIVLWMFWPSFNGALLFDDVTVQQRVVVNTYIAICASCVTGILTSALMHKGKFAMIEVQNATLAGGVSIGMSCSLNVAPWVPVLIGGLAGALSSIGYAKIAELLEGFGVMDSAGATQLHGIPGVFGALAAGIVVLATPNSYNQYFSRDTMWTEGDGVGTGEQFGMILASIAVTLLISFVVGVLNGLLIRLPIFDTVNNIMLINESPFFEEASELQDDHNGKEYNALMEHTLA